MGVAALPPLTPRQTAGDRGLVLIAPPPAVRRAPGGMLWARKASAGLHERTSGHVAYHMYRDTQGRWRWRLVSADGRLLALAGAGYASESECSAAIDLVKGSAASAPVHKKP
jgi:uncharacterized protein